MMIANNESLFNTPFEMGLRVAILLSQAKRQEFTMDRIICLDFIACYAADFELPYDNLHGDSSYRYGEISSRRMLVQEAIKSLVTDGLIAVNVEDGGYAFNITDKGKKFADKLVSDYAVAYRTIAKEVIKKYKNNTEEGIIATIQNYSLVKLRG